MFTVDGWNDKLNSNVKNSIRLCYVEMAYGIPMVQIMYVNTLSFIKRLRFK